MPPTFSYSFLLIGHWTQMLPILIMTFFFSFLVIFTVKDNIKRTSKLHLLKLYFE